MPVMDSDVAEVLEVVVLEQLEFEPRCQVVTRIVPPFGDHPAQWSLRCRQCADVTLICTAHIAYLRERLAAPTHQIQCEVCRATGPTLEALYQVVPL